MNMFKRHRYTIVAIILKMKYKYYAYDQPLVRYQVTKNRRGALLARNNL